jgi:dTDP-4-dehydrorhamnose reductase
MAMTMSAPRLVVLGPRGQVGWELLRALQPLGQVIAADRRQADLADPDHLIAQIAALKPDVLVNAAAWTAVDAAEQQAAQALRVNGTAPGLLARAARACGALLIHYSSDYVFDGSGSRPWRESDDCAPINLYGRSKLLGEQAIAQAGGDWLILRTSWVYASRGGNFVRTMLRLGSERDSLRIVADQIGAPTPARLIAETTAHLIRQSMAERQEVRFKPGLFHLSATGETSWHGFAQEIFARWRELAPDQPLKVTELRPIASADYPTPAQRPLNSRLSCDALAERFDVALPDWRSGLTLVLDELADCARA